MKAENIKRLTLTKEEARILEDFWHAADDLGFDEVEDFISFYERAIIHGELDVKGVKIFVE